MYEIYCGKMFIAFVALVLLQSFRWFERFELQKKNSDTVATLLGELEKYTILVKMEGSCIPLYAMNKKQKTLFKALNITEGEVEEDIRHLKIGQ